MPISFECSTCGKKMRAPDDAGGKKVRCPGCEAVVVVPLEVLDAEAIEEPPAVESAGYNMEAAPTAAATPAADDKERKACPLCGEMILASAAKCRYCGEIFDPKLRAREQKKQGLAKDADLTTGDRLVAILCSGIGCIIGIVWLIQGKPKGTKMLGLSFAMVVFWNIVNVILQATLLHQNRPN